MAGDFRSGPTNPLGRKNPVACGTDGTTAMLSLQRSLLLSVLVFLALLPAPVRAQEPPQDLEWRRRVAAADLRLASQWLAHSYQIPTRVPQEMLLAGYNYSDTLVALALIGQGASLNEVLELRQTRLWPAVARSVEIDPGKLPASIQDLLSYGLDAVPPRALHFLPDVRPGLSQRLRLPAFSPTVPDPVAVARFRLRPQEVANVRRVLHDPNDVSEADLHLPAGRSLKTADWLIAATLARFKPFPLEILLETRVGEVIEWGDVVSTFGMSPKVLTEGPLAAVYPVVSGMPAGTVLAAHRRTEFPNQVPLRYDLELLAFSERNALQRQMAWTYHQTEAERNMLEAARPQLDLGEQAIALALTRNGRLDLSVILERRQAGENWSAMVRRFSIDMTGQDDLWAAIRVRERH